MPITESQRKILRQLASRQGRRKSPFFVCEGQRCCFEALTRCPDWVEWIVVADDVKWQPPPTSAPLYRVDRKQFKALSQTEHPQGILAVMRRPAWAEFPTFADSFVLVLDRVATPGNVGTILRTAWAVGVSAVAYTKGTADPFGAKAVRAGMGAQFALQLHPFADLSAVIRYGESRGYSKVWIASPRGDVDYRDAGFDLHRCILVLGNEGHGVTEWANAQSVEIPMPGSAESLNVAQAATLLLFESVRRQEPARLQ